MTFTNIFTKKIFSISEVNAYKVLKYNLCESDCSGKIIYGIQIISNYKNKPGADIMENISGDKMFVNKIINYLYQNGVDEISFKDVVNDLLFEIEEDRLKNLYNI